MTRKTLVARSRARAGGVEALPQCGVFTRVVAIVVGLENYRKPAGGDALPQVDFAHADAEAFAAMIGTSFSSLLPEDVSLELIKDGDASLTALRDLVGYTTRNLSSDDLFVFYYAGHGFHGAGGNRLSAYETNPHNVAGTSFHLRDDLLDPLAQSDCSRALIFIDACAEKFRDVVDSRDVISNLNAEEMASFLDSGWYCGVFLSCSPGEKSYPSRKMGHGVWTHFLLQAMSGAEQALTDDRWLTDFGLRDYLRQEVPRFITREMTVRGTQTPQAILSGSNTFQIRHVSKASVVPTNHALAAIKLRNNSEFLEGEETGAIRGLDGFTRGIHTVPTQASSSADAWCQRLLAPRVAEELQELYDRARSELGARRRDLRKEEDNGSGELDASAFRFFIEASQNPDEPSEFIIRRRLELRQGWLDQRDSIETLFGSDFSLLVVEFDKLEESFDDIVSALEDIEENHGGEVHDDDRQQRVTYSRDGATFTFDLKRRRLEMSFRQTKGIELIEAASKFQLGISRPSAVLSGPKNGRQLAASSEAKQPRDKQPGS